jgi:hypothetical protein
MTVQYQWARQGECVPVKAAMVITKSERYREILATLARHGIGVVDDELIKHEAGDRARAEHLRRACEELSLPGCSPTDIPARALTRE